MLLLAHNPIKLTGHRPILPASDAASVKPGDWLLASAGPRRVVDVRPFADAVRAPLTLNDRIVVDGVAASTFAHSETLYKPLVAPLKLAYALAPSALASAPIQSLIDTVVAWTDAYEQRFALSPVVSA